MPEMMANQLYFMVIAAAQEKLQASNPKSLSHARNAASALIAAQTKKEFRISKNTAYAMAASFLAICIISGGLLMSNMSQHAKENFASNPQVPIQTVIPQPVASEMMADPQQTAALMAQIEQMRHGN